MPRCCRQLNGCRYCAFVGLRLYSPGHGSCLLQTAAVHVTAVLHRIWWRALLRDVRPLVIHRTGTCCQQQCPPSHARVGGCRTAVTPTTSHASHQAHARAAQFLLPATRVGIHNALRVCSGAGSVFGSHLCARHLVPLVVVLAALEIIVGGLLPAADTARRAALCATRALLQVACAHVCA